MSAITPTCFVFEGRILGIHKVNGLARIFIEGTERQQGEYKIEFQDKRAPGSIVFGDRIVFTVSPLENSVCE